jgi:hypothetical protein
VCVCIGVDVEMSRLIVGVTGGQILVLGKKSLQGVGIWGRVLLC